MRSTLALLSMCALLFSCVSADEESLWARVDGAWCVNSASKRYCLPEAAYAKYIRSESVSFEYKAHESDVASYIESFGGSSVFVLTQTRADEDRDDDLAYVGLITIRNKNVEEYQTPATSILQVKIDSDVVVQVHSGVRATGLHIMDTLLVARDRP